MSLLCLLLFVLQPAAASGGMVDVGEVEISDSPQEAIEAAAAALKARQFDQAASLYASLAESGGGLAARYWEGLARYEGGDLRGARRVLEQGGAAEPQNYPARNLLALVLVDGGSVDAGITLLEKLRGEAPPSSPVLARALVNLGLAELDRGDSAAATRYLQEAQSLAKKLGDAEVEASATDSLGVVAALAGKDTGVGRMLGKGDLRAAAAEVDRLTNAATTKRDRLEALILKAAVQRTEGNLESAIATLGEVVKQARAAGAIRELATALGQLGVVQSVAGRHALAADALGAGVEEARKGGYRVVEVDLRCELGIVLVRLDRLDDAAAQQQAAGALLGTMDYPQGQARHAELGGMVAAARGDLATATQALARAVSFSEQLGRPLDAARAATGLAGALEVSAPAEADRWGSKAEALFTQAGDPLGAAHVALARGLAEARAKKPEAALGWFGKAADVARKVGGARGRQVEAIAREDAAQTLVMLGQSEDVARLAAAAGVSDLLERQRDLATAFSAYEEGLVAYQNREWQRARERFLASRQLFEKVQESQYAMRARTAAAWAIYNETVLLPPASSYAAWAALVEETVKLDAPELYARSYGAATMSAVASGKTGLGDRFRECIRIAEGQGLDEVAARCHGALAEAEGDLKERARHARIAFAQNPSEAVGVYSLYCVAVDAYNAGNNELARELAQLARPKASSLAKALDDLIAGTQ
ncbi:MAG TPA: hypothetical protein PLA94_04920 [Myxococcota bacterium]|nr:hypothetical protein [Myxococcota bacterium]